jgi:hypothetical protein
VEFIWRSIPGHGGPGPPEEEGPGAQGQADHFEREGDEKAVTFHVTLQLKILFSFNFLRFAFLL